MISSTKKNREGDGGGVNDYEDVGGKGVLHVKGMEVMSEKETVVMASRIAVAKMEGRLAGVVTPPGGRKARPAFREGLGEATSLGPASGLRSWQHVLPRRFTYWSSRRGRNKYVLEPETPGRENTLGWAYVSWMTW